jgi:polar amino acid transport system permease protein
MELALEWAEAFLAGALVVLEIFAVSLVLTVIIGLLGASAKLSNSRFLRWLAQAYTTVFRGTPEILVLLIIYFGSAISLTELSKLFDPSVQFVDIPPFWAGSLALGLIVGAYATETFRGAFQGVPKGQVEAARALGLSRGQVFFYVRLPQMWRLALPTFGNHMLSLMKDTALISIIGLEEIMYTAKIATSVTSMPFTMYAMVGVIYLVFTWLISLTVRQLERNAARHLRGAR